LTEHLCIRHSASRWGDAKMALERPDLKPRPAQRGEVAELSEAGEGGAFHARRIRAIGPGALLGVA
jgi:hypothetical protein